MDNKDFYRKWAFVYATILISFVVILACEGSYYSHNYRMGTRPVEDYWEEVVPYEEPVEEVAEEEVVEPIEIYVPSDVPFVRTTEFVNLTFDEMDFLQQIAMAESGNQDEIGQALVMLTVLNRSEFTGMSIYQVFYAKGQFTTVADPNFGHYTPNENCNKALAMIMDGWNETDFDPEWDTNEKVYYFGTGVPAYGNIGFKYGGHYFNTRTVKGEK